MKTYTFEAEIKKIEGKDATYVEIPFDVEKEFAAKRVKVLVKFENEQYRGSIVNMGLSCYIIGVTKEIRNKINKTYGDIIKVELQKDEKERIVIVPEEFKVKLSNNKIANDFYESLSYSQKRKYIQWITSAKKEETKIKGMEEAIVKLENKIKM
ncbi:YdeI/OmpD-associated family protein [Clostridium sporogenes]|uniref:YdeI/OmpD-associated family protein n=1 Tax=Clostridium sporogenes TaxID=1509 RepID=UPI002149D6F6|nr:YdeI/OmpD-associated family protein [Clostridium sporogenes]MCR1975409.1 YdeI/OmpD-associated family protein [Clostridium sporogenes]